VSEPAAPTSPALVRRLGTGDAIVVGLGSMVGAGVFTAFGPAAVTAGGWLLIGLGVAAAVAFCNAVASAQLAMQYPTSGGTYVYGRERLGHGWGFLAGWGFVVGKTASCAAMGVLLAGSLGALGVVIAVIIFSGQASTDRLALGTAPSGAYGVLQSAGLLFFAFAGYARIATLGEEVRDPAHTIPRAVSRALALAVIIYAAVGASALAALGAEALGRSATPLATSVGAVGSAWAEPVVRIGAAIASLGALLALLAGIGRTGLAMAREGDLPRDFSAVHPVHRVPHRVQLLVAAVALGLVLTVDLRGVIGCMTLVAAVVAGVLVFAIGVAGRALRRSLMPAAAR
jgi:APA family basic amino acid/polyamine antiporter